MYKRTIGGLATLALVFSLCGSVLAQIDDPALMAAGQRLEATFRKYDRQVRGLLDKKQAAEFNDANEDTHPFYFRTHVLTRAEVNGYEAFLGTRLHLTAEQEEQLSRIEWRMLNECGPLQRDYRRLLREDEAR